MCLGAEVKPQNDITSVPSVENAKKCWLDLLPSDVCDQYVTKISEGKQNLSALCLAEFDSAHRDSVLRSLVFRFEALRDPQLGARWANVFRDRVKCISFRKVSTDGKDISPLLNPPSLALFASPSLRRVEMSSHPTLLTAIAAAPNLQELYIHFNSAKQPPPHELLKTLKTLRITSLELVADVQVPMGCVLNEIAELNGTPLSLAECCPHVRSLSIKCFCPTRYHPQGDPLWNILPWFSNLEELTLQREPPPYLIPTLSQIQSVKINYGLYSSQLAKCLADSVTSFHTSCRQNVLQISEIAACTNLLQLSIPVHEGSEIAVLQTIRNMKSLQKLELLWKNKRNMGHGGNTLSLSSHYKPQEGILLQIVKCLPFLESLKLLFVAIGIEEMKLILQHTGDTLKSFSTSIFGQEESPIERLAGLVPVIDACNSNLNSFGTDWNPHSFSRLSYIRLQELIKNDDKERLCKQTSMIRQNLKRLQQRCPRWNFHENRKLDSFLTAIEELVAVKPQRRRMSGFTGSE